MITVIIPARQEPYINKTIQSLYDNAVGEIEVIVVLDGEKADIDSRAEIIFHPQPLGRRTGMNEAARKARGEYLLHIDAHCSMTPEWDRKLMESCEEKTVVVSIVAAMDESTWQIKPNHYYTFVSLDSNLKEHWWGKYKPLRKWTSTNRWAAVTRRWDSYAIWGRNGRLKSGAAAEGSY
jgi:glycosyltransferase involved in cell wall biosynthesis